MAALIRHLHDFAREVKLTEEEFHAAMGYIVALGKHTNETHNEAVLMAGSLGLSTLICLLNNGDSGQTETDANLLGPFWRMDSPPTKNGDSIVRSPTPGPALFVDAWFRDADGKPIEGAEVDIWQSSPEGFYENQDPVQADMNLRGKFTTDKDGHISFRSVKPAGYPIPIDGPVGELLRAAGPAQYAAVASALSGLQAGLQDADLAALRSRDKHIETDVQFGVTRHLIGNYVRHDGAARTRPTSRRRGIRSSTLCHGERHGAPAAAADQRQSARRAAGNSASRTGVNSSERHGRAVGHPARASETLGLLPATSAG